MPSPEFRLPAEVLADLQKEGADLLDAGQAYARARRELAHKQEVWDTLAAKRIIAIVAGGEKLAADVREAKVLDSITADHPDLYGELVMAKANVEAGNVRVKVHTARMDALRSELAYLKTEWEATK